MRSTRSPTSGVKCKGGALAELVYPCILRSEVWARTRTNTLVRARVTSLARNEARALAEWMMQPDLGFEVFQVGLLVTLGTADPSEPR